MTVFQMKLPDVGEGVAEAEIVDWLVEVGDEVTPDSVLAEVLTDKATVEVSSPVTGVVTALHGEPGDVVAVGGELVDIDVTDASGQDGPAQPPTEEPHGAPAVPPAARADDPEPPAEQELATDDVRAASADGARPDLPRPDLPRPTAAPAVRARARDLGIDLGSVRGTGPDGRVVHADLDRIRSAAGSVSSTSDAPQARPVRGVRRKIAERLSAAWSEIPHITYVDGVDVTELERLRSHLNDRLGSEEIRLTLLPFVARAVVLACADQPELNAHYDHAAQSLEVFDAVNVGIATQTDNGLLVPVVRHAEALGLKGLARAIAEVTAAARDGVATRDQLSGSTITITSLGSIGGVVTTPIINAPEVAIIGVNKMEVRPVWTDGAFVPRTVLNLSSSFDHRMVDGWDAATFVQRIKALLETPALLFVDA